MEGHREEYCCYCGLKITISVFRTTEHVTPKSWKHVPKDKRAAKRACCKGCNAMRGNMPLETFIEHLYALSNANPESEHLKTMCYRVSNIIRSI